MSMMAHRVRILPGKTFRLNLCVCPPYNADFDGDEMNLHVPQSEEARAEARILMDVQEHIVSPRFGGPVIGMTHDHITGLFLLTQRGNRFSKSEIEFMLSTIEGIAFPRSAGKGEDGEPYWTGKQLFSALLNKTLKMEYKSAVLGKNEPNSEASKEIDGYVNIINGTLLDGVIDGNSIGAFKGKLLDRIARDYGNEAARVFLDKSTRLALSSIMLRGFTTGLDDEDIPVDARMQINAKLNEATENVKKLIEAYEEETLELLPGRSLEETLEVEIMKVLGKARDKAGEIAGQYLGLQNSAVIMARTGARGSMLNLSQMAGCIGQQAVRGERISRGYRNRTLPHFKENDKGADAKGFVKASYKTGMNATEYFFHSMGGREALVDTAVRTSRSGYMQRRLINALEDLKVVSDGSVRNTAGTVIQFCYGEDGVDPTRSEQGENINVDNLISAALGLKYGEVRTITEDMVGYGEFEEAPPEGEQEVEPDEFENEEG
jgi:DNA-directed RNA polymerase subunit A'